MFGWNENHRLKTELKDLQHAHEKEQGKGARVTGFLARLQSFGISADGQIPLKALAETTVDAMATLLQADQVIFMNVDVHTLDYVLVSARGFSPDALSRLKIKSTGDLQNVLAAPHLVFPLTSVATPVGILAAGKPMSGAFSAEDRATAALLANQCALLLGSYTFFTKQGASRQAAVETLVRAIEAKDSCTHLHGNRTRTLVRAICSDMSLPEVLIQQIEDGAYLHDVGKIGIPDSILKKPSELTDEERRIMQTHSAMGRKILDPFPSLRAARAIVLYHQEWYNGGGYPEGLAGEEIPLGARIVQILDAWDAMTSDRPYRKAMPKPAAIAELRRQSGSQFDPKLVDIFLRTIDRLERAGVATTEIA